MSRLNRRRDAARHRAQRGCHEFCVFNVCERGDRRNREERLVKRCLADIMRVLPSASRLMPQLDSTPLRARRNLVSCVLVRWPCLRDAMRNLPGSFDLSRADDVYLRVSYLCLALLHHHLD